MAEWPTWKAGWRKPDRRPIWEWLHDHWTLPPAYQGPGRFDVSRSRHLMAPFTSFQDDAVKEITCMAAVQTGKTLFVEGCISWVICNSPGPIMWTLQTDDDARKHCDERFMEALKSIKGVRDIMPDGRHQKTKTDIYFGPFFLSVNGANLNSLQRVSIRYKFNSEVHLWKQGLLDHARARVSAFEQSGNSKIVNESQGGIADDDFDKAYKAGHQAEWAVRCFGCGRLSPLVFSGNRADDPLVKANVVWNADARRSDGTWNVGRACETARWECPFCGVAHDDSARTRARWNADGEYLVCRKDAPAPLRSYRWEAMVARPMADLVSQFLEARRQQKQGVMQAMMDFTRQRRALPWKDDMANELVLLRGAGYLLTDPALREKIDNESVRFMTVDRQRDHFWVVIRGWRFDSSSRLLYFSRTQTVEQLVDLAALFHVEQQLVFEDTGYFPDGGYADCARYGWTALKGSGELSFPIEVNGAKFRRMWSQAVRIQKDARFIPLVHWASDPIKDVLHNVRSGKGAKWETPDDLSPEYENHMSGDRKKAFENKKSGRQEWRWQRVHANHAWDCEAMQIAAALMTNVLSSPTPPKEETTSPTPVG